MTPTRSRFCAFVATVLVLPLWSARALAEWPHDLYTNVEIFGAENYRNSPRACPDGLGGAFVCWQDYERTPECHCRIFTDVVIRHVSRDGVPLGAGLMLSTGGDTGKPLIVSDGQGGELVAWRNGYEQGEPGIFVQRVGGSGSALWTFGGVRVSSEAAQTMGTPMLASDGQGGAVVAWLEIRDEYGTTLPRVYVQRVSGDGSILWSAGGRAVAEAQWEMLNPSLCGTGDGGAILAWEDARSGDSDIYVQRLRPGDGIISWPGGYDEEEDWGGVAVALQPGSAQSRPQIVSDGAGAACIVWQDTRNGNVDLFAQRMSSDGHAAWVPGGRPVTTASGEQQDAALDSDGSGGVVVAWRDFRNAADGDVFAQRLDAGGRTLWNPDGVAMSRAAGTPTGVQAATDGSGGVIASWMDARLGALDVWAQRVSADGTVRWAPDGAAVSLAGCDQFNASLTADGRGGAIVVWDDARSTYSRSIFGQRIDRSGDLGDPAPEIAGVLDVPLDQGGKVKVDWHASYLDADPLYTVGTYWLWRSVPEAAALAAFRRGAALIEGEESAATSGLRPHGGILKTTEPNGIVYWEFVAAETATADPGYSLVVATTSDSMPEGNPVTLFRVQARHRDGITSWTSATEGGYSKDNLSPPPPAGLAATVSNGALRLHWERSAVPDFAAFRVYEGASADFVPGAGNLVAAQPDTGYTAGLGYSVFKLTTVDVHGNESSYSTLAASTIVSVPGPGVSSLEMAVTPNPTRDRLRLHFALPKAADVRIRLFDVAGRTAFEFVRGSFGAGPHDLEWSGGEWGDVASGMYYLCMDSGASQLVRRIVVSR